MSAEFFKKDNTPTKRAYLIGALLGVLSTVVMMLVFSALLLFLNLDRGYSAPFATISVAVGCFLASLYTAKKVGSRGYVVGLIIGSTVFVIITLLSLIIGDDGLSLNTLFHFVIMMLSSLVGGIMGVNSDKHKKFI